MSDILNALAWRYATKKFDITKPLSIEQVTTLEEALRLSASSLGLQPWGFVEVTNPEIRAKLRAKAWGQPQVTDADRIIVLAARTDLDDAYVDRFAALIAQTTGAPIETLKDYVGMMKGSLAGKTPEQRLEWAKRQTYIALGTILAVAAIERIDACPMEGFDPAGFDEILGLKEKNLASVAMVALGFRHADDATANKPKVRFPRNEVFIDVK